MLFDAPLSEGTLAGLSVDAAERLAPFMTELAALIRSSTVVCADGDVHEGGPFDDVGAYGVDIGVDVAGLSRLGMSSGSGPSVMV